jgi:hypothetical protein
MINRLLQYYPTGPYYQKFMGIQGIFWVTRVTIDVGKSRNSVFPSCRGFTSLSSYDISLRTIRQCHYRPSSEVLTHCLML